VNFLLCWVSENATASGNDTFALIMSMIIAVGISPQGGLEENILLYVCTRLSRYERPHTYSRLRRSQMIKFFLVRNMNVIGVNLCHWFIQTFPEVFILKKNLKQERVILQECGLVSISDSYLTFMLMAIVIMPPINAFVYPLCTRYIIPLCERIFYPPLQCLLPFDYIWRSIDKDAEKRQAELLANSDDPNREWSEFCLGGEYMEILYRQFLIFMGTAVIPLLPAFGVIGFLIDFYLVRLRLLKFHKRPHPMEGSYKTSLMVLLIVTAVFASISFPQGIMLIMTGYKFRKHCPGSLWTSGRNAWGYTNGK